MMLAALTGPEKGRGIFRIYAEDKRFVISIFDFVLDQDLIQNIELPDFISIGWYDSISGTLFSPLKKKLKPGMLAHTGSHNRYRSRIFKYTPVQGTTINIMPEYYKRYLRSRYPGEYENLNEVFESIDGKTDFPRLRMVMRQIGSCGTEGNPERLYLESKVAEAISLVAEQARTETKNRGHQKIDHQDRKNLEVVVAYIEANLSRKISLSELSKVARMGTTKLKYTFKKIHNATISEFILQRRMLRAEHLLTHTELTIQQIAFELGYQNQGGFSKTFRKSLGMLPNEYRKCIDSV